MPFVCCAIQSQRQRLAKNSSGPLRHARESRLSSGGSPGLVVGAFCLKTLHPAIYRLLLRLHRSEPRARHAGITYIVGAMIFLVRVDIFRVIFIHHDVGHGTPKSVVTIFRGIQHRAFFVTGYALPYLDVPDEALVIRLSQDDAVPDEVLSYRRPPVHFPHRGVCCDVAEFARPDARADHFRYGIRFFSQSLVRFSVPTVDFTEADYCPPAVSPAIGQGVPVCNRPQPETERGTEKRSG